MFAPAFTGQISEKN
jgi:hypothetical protein